MKIRSMLILGILVIALGTWIIHQSNRIKNSERIQQLEDSITQKNIELEKKSDSIKNLTTEVLDFSEDIKNNTIEIESLSIQIKDLSKNTNQISRAIKKEQKTKGRLKLFVPDYEKYRIILGGAASSQYSKKSLENGIGLIHNSSNDPILKIRLIKGELVINVKVYDSYQNLIVDITNNNWAIGGDLFSKNFDKNSIEIIDKKGVLVFQLGTYEDYIIIKGILFNPQRVNVLTDNITTALSLNDPELIRKVQRYSSNITRIFDHKGENYLGKKNPASSYIKELISIQKRNKRRLNEYDNLSLLKIVEIAKSWVDKAIDFKEKWSKENPEKSTEEFQNTLIKKREIQLNNLLSGQDQEIYLVSENESDPVLRDNYLDGVLILEALSKKSSSAIRNYHSHALSYPENYSFRKFCELIQDMGKSINEIEEIISENKRKKLFKKKKIQYNKLGDKEIKKKILIIIEEYKEFLDVHELQDKKISSYLYEGNNDEYFEKSNSFYKKIRKEYSDNFQDEIVLLMLQLISRNPDIKKLVGEYDGHMLEHPHNMLGFKEVLTIVKKLSKDFIESN